MKKKRTKNSGLVPIHTDEILPEYDFSHSRPNKYALRKASGMLVLLDPKLSKMFPDSRSVNRALRLLANTAKAAARQEKRARSTR